MYEQRLHERNLPGSMAAGYLIPYKIGLSPFRHKIGIFDNWLAVLLTLACSSVVK